MTHDLHWQIQKEMIDGLVKQAYENWESLQVVETPMIEQFEGKQFDEFVHV